tara:strand:- start:136 stop:1719 length:1584 start_codon:yes stop_codon:yes gene_type:complete
MNIEILNVVREKGILLEKDVYKLVEALGNIAFAKGLIESVERSSGKKMITVDVLEENLDAIRVFLGGFGDLEREGIENAFLGVGLNLNEKKEDGGVREPHKKEDGVKYKVFYADTLPDKKLEVKDFVGHFRARYQELQRILMNRPELQQNLVGINKISSDRGNIAIIGIVTEKRVTKNGNLIIKFEDLTGEVVALVKGDREEVFAKGDELQMDDVVGVKASGNRDMLFVQDIFFPDSFNLDPVRFDEDVCVAFLSDIHCGSNKHLGRSFNNFLKWINSDDVNAKKIKYVFISGDNVDGVGVFPGQEEKLKLNTMEEQYALLASYLKRLPEGITCFVCPGQHDATRVAEPQPIIMKKYAEELHNLDNVILVTNPTMVKLVEGDKEFKVQMYHGASIHTFINEVKELREMKAHNSPAKAVKHMLKRRHLAPMHGVSPSVVYVPNSEKDPMVISEVPDVLCTGEVHRLDIERYNGTLIITGSCWQDQTDFEEKVGNIPDPGKVPVFNLKSGELRVFDFLIEDEVTGEVVK